MTRHGAKVVPLITARAKRERAARASDLRAGFERIVGKLATEMFPDYDHDVAVAALWSMFEEHLPDVLDDGASEVEWRAWVETGEVYMTDAPEPPEVA